MSQKQYQLYDFRKSAATDSTGVSFKIWIEKMSQRIKESWSELAAGDASLHVDQFQTKSYGKALEIIPGTSLGCVVQLNEGAAAAVWHISQTDALALIANLLGLPAEAEQTDRPLTQIEIAMCTKVFEALLRWLGESWPRKETLPCELGEVLINPKRLRLARPDDLATTIKLVLKIPHGDVTINWISQKQKTGDLLEAIVDRRAKQKQSADPAQVVQQLPIEIIGLLGEATMSISGLAALKPGDILVLNQKIDKPVVAKIDDRPYYHCWPGKIGSHQGLEIADCLQLKT